MKRVIGGVSYNTNTSTLVAKASWEENDGHVRYTNQLYQTRGGAFFLHTHKRNREWSKEDNAFTIAEIDSFEPMTYDEAQNWVLNGNDVEQINEKIFGEVPEATAETPTEATLFIRLPVSLKERIEDNAKSRGLSVNATVMRCLEAWLSDPSAKSGKRRV
jgi:hypothetical protein